jgi:hypothetical protein
MLKACSVRRGFSSSRKPSRVFRGVEKLAEQAPDVVPEVDERRQYQRVEPEGATITMIVSGETVTFDIDNLSEGGALIAGRIGAPIGSVVDLRVNLPELLPIPLQARLLRYVPQAGGEYTAVMFLSVSELVANWISDLVLQGLREAFPEL